MKVTYIMGIYKTTVVFHVLRENRFRTVAVHTRANSVETAEAMALGKIMKDWAGDHFIKLTDMKTEMVKEALNVAC